MHAALASGAPAPRPPSSGGAPIQRQQSLKGTKKLGTNKVGVETSGAGTKAEVERTVVQTGWAPLGYAGPAEVAAQASLAFKGTAAYDARARRVTAFPSLALKLKLRLGPALLLDKGGLTGEVQVQVIPVRVRVVGARVQAVFDVPVQAALSLSAELARGYGVEWKLGQQRLFTQRSVVIGMPVSSLVAIARGVGPTGVGVESWGALVPDPELVRAMEALAELATTRRGRSGIGRDGATDAFHERLARHRQERDRRVLDKLWYGWRYLRRTTLELADQAQDLFD